MGGFTCGAVREAVDANAVRGAESTCFAIAEVRVEWVIDVHRWPRNNGLVG